MTVESEKHHKHCFLFFKSETSRAAHSRNLFPFKIQNRLQQLDLLIFVSKCDITKACSFKMITLMTGMLNLMLIG